MRARSYGGDARLAKIHRRVFFDNLGGWVKAAEKAIHVPKWEPPKVCQPFSYASENNLIGGIK